MRTNSNEQNETRVRSLKEEMDAFDRLPRRLRHVIANSHIRWSGVATEKALRKLRSVDAVISLLEDHASS